MPTTTTEPLLAAGTMHSDNVLANLHPNSFRQFPEPGWIFDELPKATIVSVSRPDTAGDFSPMLLSYTIELQYKQACNSLSLSLLLPFFLLPGSLLVLNCGWWISYIYSIWLNVVGSWNWKGWTVVYWGILPWTVAIDMTMQYRRQSNFQSCFSC